MCLNFAVHTCQLPSTFFLSPIMSTNPINWSKVPHTNLVSNSEDDAKVVEVKAGEKQRREEEVKVERQRQKEVSNKGITCCGDDDDNWYRCER